MENNAIINNVVDIIPLNETKKSPPLLRPLRRLRVLMQLTWCRILGIPGALFLENTFTPQRRIIWGPPLMVQTCWGSFLIVYL